MAALGGKLTLPRYKTAVGRFVHHLSLVALLLLSGCVSMRPQGRESITVSRQPWYGICAGVCPDYDVTVSNVGQVAVGRPSGVLHGQADGFPAFHVVDQFRVSRAEAAAFRRMLLPFRPSSEQREFPLCWHDVRPEERPLVLKVIEIEITWSGGDHPARLVTCDGTSLNEAIRKALWSVHLYLDGRRRD